MKKLIALLLLACSFTGAFAQDENDVQEKPKETKKKMHCSRLFVDISSGINNNASLLGGGVDYHVSNDFSVNGGIGIMSTWGYKFYLGGKVYFKPCHRGWAIGGGATFNTGIPEYVNKMETVTGPMEQVELNCLPQLNIFAAAYYHWRVGKKNNRMFLQLGWSKGVMNEKFRQTAGSPLSHTSAAVMRLLAPGGPIVGLGFSFGTN